MKVVRRVVKTKKGQPRVYKSNQGWRTIADRRIYFRSSWEVNFAKYLEFLKGKNQIKEWLFEPQTFWFNAIKRGVRSYMPDFKVIRNDGSHYWVEVKGYMDAKSQTKIKRFHKYYPEEKLHVITAEWFKKQKNDFPNMTENWENQFTEPEQEYVG